MSLQIRVRNDLQAYPRGSGLDTQWVIKDPVSFSHFLFSREEVFLLNLFNGKRTIEQVRRIWQKEFQTLSLTETQLQTLAERFIRDKLVLVEGFGNGVRLHDEERQSKRAQLLMKLSSPLVVKLGGVDPRSILELLWIPGQILFNRFVVVITMFVSLIVFGYFIGHFEEIIARAPTMATFFSAKNLILMTGIIVVVKIVHELSHAVACRKFGGECFEIGVLLLAFFPTLYCDVSDSWTFPERWKRIMVSFAGVYVEILMASISAILWLLSDPGFANSIFFNIAVMCSFNTIFVNGNPLLRYDGYYIVSDLFEQPNLAENARQNLRRVASSFFFDLEEKNVTNLWLALFGFFSMLYRWFVVASIALGVYVLLKRFDFGLLSDAIVFLLLASVVFRMVKQASLDHRKIQRRINITRSLATTLLLVAILLSWCFFPVPSNVYCNFGVESTSSSIVYAPKNGKLSLDVSAYDIVEPGQLLGEVISPELDDQRQQTTKRLKHLEDRADRLVKRFDQEASVAAEVELIRNEIRKVQAQSDAQAREQENLILTSASQGMVRPLTINTDPNVLLPELQDPYGSLFDAQNKDCFVRRGQPLFVIEGREKKLVSYLGEKDVEFLAVGQKVVVGFNQQIDLKRHGIIEEIIEIDVDLNESETESSGMETYIDQVGNTQTLQTPYRVIISVEDFPVEIMVGSSGRARVSVPMRTMLEKTLFVLDRWWNEQNY